MSVNGVSLEYRRIVGNPALPALVLLHQGLGCNALWRDFPDRLALATGRSVLLYSRAGYGGSDAIPLPRPLEYMSLEATDVLPQVLENAGITEHTLVGHSDGASIALVYAGEIRDPNLKSLVLLAPHVFAEQSGVDSVGAARETYTNGDLRDRLKKYHGDNVDCAFLGWSDSWMDPRFLRWSIESALGGVAVPVLQIQGRDDEYGTVEQLRRIEKGVKSSVQTLLFEECGHAPHLERSEDTLRAIVQFCTS
ncbi:MAG: alpha/beta hydrolase [Gammaproteobacteria bacterium]|jgi:pimeloyl-ACP methyl ester carboxylesterase|nr:alpha/beta hydrolase [Gammaproteobacteria bacterium]